VGTGRVDRLRARGRAVVPASYATGMDLVRGAGLARAFEGAEVTFRVAEVLASLTEAQPAMGMLERAEPAPMGLDAFAHHALRVAGDPACEPATGTLRERA